MDPGVVTLRRAVLADQDAIRKVHKNSIERHNASLYDKKVIETWTDPVRLNLARLLESKEEVWVATRADQVVGFSNMSVDRATKVAYIDRLYVDPEHGRQGLGSLLLNKQIEIAKEKKMAVVKLEASLFAVSFYVKHGFVKGTRTLFYFQGSDIGLVVMPMSLTIA
jgi:putative acetyltransferase